ncbi:hypothetical protein TNCV_1191701 [Trichonephila clavipes]|nr:hypothetical protein TNCV_1191701 [Trichonephila clavipes]
MPSQYTRPLVAEVHGQMSRIGGLSEERPSVFKTPSKLGTHLSTQCSGDERQSRPCPAAVRSAAAESQLNGLESFNLILSLELLLAQVTDTSILL